ncbi:hypothetical protein HY484_03860 [Candidatus Woesearchaeota archaeon]|nr:hypothetical protein [Candidatus Woesearchaeota archaeon]
MLEKIVGRICVASSLFFAGCTTYRPMNNETARSAVEFPDAVKKKYLSASFDGWKKDFVASAGDYVEYNVKLFSNRSEVASFQTIESRIGNNDKWIVMYPILGGDDLELPGFIARHVLADEGISTAVILRKEELMYESIPPRPLQSDDKNVVDVEDYVQNALFDTVRVIKYLRVSGMKDFGFMGISLGGMQVIGTAALFPESKINIMMMAGGNVEEIVMNSSERPVKAYREYWVNELGEEVFRANLKKIKIDPLLIAKYVPTDKVRMVITTKDDAVPTKCQFELYDALGKPESLLVPSNHYTLVLYYFQTACFVEREVNEAFGLNK